MLVHARAERVEHDRAGDAEVGGDRQCVAGVVVEPGEDLDVDAVGESVVGEVGLPGFVGLVGFEADVGRLGSLRSVRGDEPGSGAGGGGSVEVDTAMWWWCSRCQTMVSVPASRPG